MHYMLQVWDEHSASASKKTASPNEFTVAKPAELFDPMTSPLLAFDSSPSNIFHQQARSPHIDAGNALPQQTSNMHPARALQFSSPPQLSSDSSKPPRPYASAMAAVHRTAECDLYNRAEQLLDMSTPGNHSAPNLNSMDAHATLLNKAHQQQTNRTSMYTHCSSTHSPTDRIGSPVLSSRMIPETLTSLLSGQLLESRCTSTGHSRFARHLLPGLHLDCSLTSPVFIEYNCQNTKKCPMATACAFIRHLGTLAHMR